MHRVVILPALVLAACASAGQPEAAPSAPDAAAATGPLQGAATGPLQGAATGPSQGAMAPRPSIKPQPLPPPVARLDGELAQAGLSFWRTEPGSDVFLDGEAVPVGPEGHFALGFGRDHNGTAELLVLLPGGAEHRRTLTIADRDFPVSRITGLPPSKVDTFTEAQLAKIRADREIKLAARATRTSVSYWRSGWDWPVRGRISTRMGAQRFLNDKPQSSPHSGTDIAAPPGTTPMEFQGTPVRAPADGIVTLAHPDLYFEGGTVFIDHGQEVESVMLHLSRVDAEPGQVVRKGDIIGAVGMTGRATGPHLHWTVNWRGEPMDPQLLVPPMTPVAE